MKKIPVLLFALCISTTVFAQQHFYGGLELNYGTPFFKTSADSVLRFKGIGSAFSMGGSFGYRLFNRIQLEAGARTNRHQLSIKDKHFENRVDGFEVNIKSVTWFSNFYASLKYAHKLEYHTYLYFRLGTSYNIIRGGAESATTEYVKGFETLTINSSYSESSYSVSPEIGFEFLLKNSDQLNVGLRYQHVADNPLMQADYNVTNDGVTLAADQLTAKGNNLSLVVQYNKLLLYRPKKERKKRTKPDKPIKVDPVKETEEPVSVDDKDHTAGGRDFSVTNKVKVKSSKVTIEIWDHQMEDGDIVSLILNDKWIIQNYELKNKKKYITVELKEGHNKLILYALNLGKYEPNTAAVIVDDGKDKHQIILESTLQQSGALEIIYHKPKK